MFTGLDFILLMTAAAGVLAGTARGFVGTLVDLAGVFGGLAVASVAYLGPVNLCRRFGIAGLAVDLTCFILTLLIAVLAIILTLESFRKRTDTRGAADRLLGLGLGAVEGLIFAGGAVILFSAALSGAEDIERSRTGRFFAGVIPRTYEWVERKGLTFPKMLVLPVSYSGEFDRTTRKIRFERINVPRLEGAHCVKCGGTVSFAGYVPRAGAAMFPKLVCRECGRTSDGCQTYEGYHVLYKSCPIDAAEHGVRFDCGNWPNGDAVVPAGPCPVCGKKFQPPSAW